MEQQLKAAKRPKGYMQREQIVLTKDIKERVEKKLLWCQRRTKELFGVDVPIPEVRWDLKSRVCGMYCAPSQRPGTPFHGKAPQKDYFRFHPVFAAENTTDYCEETVPHEFGHAFVAHHYKGQPKNKQQKQIVAHGAEWMEWMVRMGLGPRGERAWPDIIKGNYNPSSLALPPRRKYGPRKIGGKNVGDILNRIEKLTPSEIAALIIRLGLEGFTKNPPEVQAEVDALEEHLHNTPEYRPLRKGALCSAGWALNVIKHKEN